MTNRYRGTLYVGVTSNLPARIHQHRCGTGSDFCTRYGLSRLVWAEHGEDIAACLQSEKRLKCWRRDGSSTYSNAENPEWRDMFDLLA